MNKYQTQHANKVTVAAVILLSAMLSACGGGASPDAAAGASNRAPLAVNDVALQNGGALNIAVLANDRDPDGDSLSLVTVSAASNGSVVIDSNGTAATADDFVTYTPNGGYGGNDSFTYSISDPLGLSATATVSVLATSTAPVANSDDASTAADTPVSIFVLANDSDPNGLTLNLVSVTTPGNGVATINDSGTPADASDDFVDYGPNSGFSGSDSFSYTVNNGAESASATVNVIVGGAGSAGVSGDVTKGPITGALIKLYRIDGKGLPTGSPVAQTASNAQGKWTVAVPLPREPLLVVSEGGRYSDETDSNPDPSMRRVIQLDATDQLEAVMPAADDYLSLNLYTNAMLLKSREETVGNEFTQVYAANRSLMTQATGFDPVSTAPTDPGNPNPAASVESKQYALLLGGAANALNAVIQGSGQTAVAFNVLSGFITDMQDCRLDGVNQDGPAQYLFLGAQRFMPTDINLNLEITRFRNNNFARYGGISASLDQTVCSQSAAVPDTLAPVITLLGSNPLTLEGGGVYSDAGFTATDDRDGDLTGSVAVTGSINTTSLGTQTLGFSVSDAAGNVGSATRTVNIVDTTPPVLTLNGTTPVSVLINTSYTDSLGSSAIDAVDGDLTGAIVSVNPVDISTAGSYAITYDVVDSSGNAAAQITRVVNVVNTANPVITLNGNSPQSHEAGTPYVDAGATANDFPDGNITSSIVSVSNVDTAVPGSYTVTYDVTDSDGNPAMQEVRTVNVVDSNAPTITLSGANPQVIEAGSPYTELGATASDSLDGDLTASIVIDATAVDTSTPGSYPVTYDVKDAAGNDAPQVIRTVSVADTTAPVIVLSGANPQTLEANTAYVELGASASDTLDGDLTASIVINTSALDPSTPGNYVVTYDVVDAAGNDAAQVTRTVNVVDTTAPIITLSGANPQTIEAPAAYTELGASASDSLDGDLTASIVIDVSAVDTSTPGSYTVTYDVADAAGNNAIQVTRTVNVVDTTPPVITVLGGDPITHEAATPYSDPGVTASDSLDGDLTASVVSGGSVDVNAPGSYVLTYDVSDAAGNAATQVTRTVNVVDSTPPVITLLGSDPITHEAATAYSDPGATASDSLDGDITAGLIRGGSVDVNTPGSYVLTFDVSDAAGNAATQVTRTVNVVDTTAPVIVLGGPNPQKIAQNKPYLELGASATDSLDGDLSAAIVIDASAVDTSTLGDYLVTYDVSDAAGNAAAQVVRTVKVLASVPAPDGDSDSVPDYIEIATGGDPSAANTNVIIVTPGTTNLDIFPIPPGPSASDPTYVLYDSNAPAAASNDWELDFRGGCDNIVLWGSLDINGDTVLDNGAPTTEFRVADGRVMRIDGCNNFQVHNIGITGASNRGMLIAGGTTATLDNVRIYSNTDGNDGAGISVDDSTLYLSNSVLSDQDSSADGGAIYIRGAASACLLEHNIFSGNNAGSEGGAIFLDGTTSACLIRNNLFTSNRSDKIGGAISANDANGTLIVNNTFAYNRADKSSGGAGGGFALKSDGGGVPALQDNIFWRNQDVFDAPSSYNDALFNGDPVTAAVSSYNLVSQAPVGTGDMDITVSGPAWESGFYLDQGSSPGVDSGSGPAGVVGLDSRFTDASGGTADLGTVDRGFHYPLAYAGNADSYTELLEVPDSLILPDGVTKALHIKPLRAGEGIGRGHHVVATVEGPNANLVDLTTFANFDALGDGESVVMTDLGNGVYAALAAATLTVSGSTDVPLRIYVDGIALPILFDISRRP